MFFSPHYGQFSLICPWGKKALTFSLNSTRLIRTPVNADNGHLFLAQSTNSHRKPTLLMRTSHYQVCCNREKKLLRHVAMVAKFLDDNKPKIHLKSKFALFQTSSILFNFI